MFFDLNIPIPSYGQSSGQSSKKGKGKQPQQVPGAIYTAAQIALVDARVDVLVHLGYSVVAFNQTVLKKVDPKSHVNPLDSLLSRLKPRPGVVFLKRLSIILDEESEKGFGLTNANVTLFNAYDLIALIPTTQATLSLACLAHSIPSPLTAHIISLPLTLPRMPFHLKHTLIRTAIKNGAVFEISYVGALGGDNDTVLSDAGAAETGANAKRNWWAAAKELTRVTKGKHILVSSGVVTDADLRAPRDVANLITLLGLPQDVSHDSVSKVPKSLVLRAQTRKSYRAVLSDPQLVIPEGSQPPNALSETSQVLQSDPLDVPSQSGSQPTTSHSATTPTSEKKRRREDKEAGDEKNKPESNAGAVMGNEGASKKKRKKNNQEAK